MSNLSEKHILLIISGGIAAYKSLDLIRRMREHGVIITSIMTKSAQEFITPLAVSILSSSSVYTDLFSWKDQNDVSHIKLARACEAVVVAPATANFIAHMAHGIADDLATAILLAIDRPILLMPAMNPTMWAHSATQRNVEILRSDGIYFIGPEYGEMAESYEVGLGRMAEPLTIITSLERLLRETDA